MMRPLVRSLLAGILGLACTGVSWGQETQTPTGYQFFTRRNRATPTAWTRIPDVGQKSASRPAACCKTAEASQAPKPPLVAEPVSSTATTVSPPEADDTTVSQVNWGGSEYGLSFGWPEEGYYPGTPSYGWGVSFPLHGYRETYDWAGHRYSLHCYCSKGYPPFQCPGYRGECYVPCWNDAGTPICERCCGRGSPWDCLWHMGGYEHRCRRTDCPNVCIGPPAYSSFGFPHGAGGDPNYVKPRGAENGERWKMRHDPYGGSSTPAAKTAPTPVTPP